MSYTRGFLYQSSSHKNFSLSYVPTFSSYPNVASPYQRPSLIPISPPHIYVSPPYQRLLLIPTRRSRRISELSAHGTVYPFQGQAHLPFSLLFFLFSSSYRDSGVQPAASCFAVFRVFPTHPLHVPSRIDRGERPGVVV